jgi:hypothetical protein
VAEDFLFLKKATLLSLIWRRLTWRRLTWKRLTWKRLALTGRQIRMTLLPLGRGVQESV